MKGIIMNKKSNYEILNNNECKILSKIIIKPYQLDKTLNYHKYLDNNKYSIDNRININNDKIIINQGKYNIFDLIFTLKEKQSILLKNRLKEFSNSDKQINNFNAIWEKHYL